MANQKGVIFIRGMVKQYPGNYGDQKLHNNMNRRYDQNGDGDPQMGQQMYKSMIFVYNFFFQR